MYMAKCGLGTNVCTWTDRSHIRSYYDEVPFYANRLDGGRQWKVVGVSHNAGNHHILFREYAVRLAPR